MTLSKSRWRLDHSLTSALRKIQTYISYVRRLKQTKKIPKPNTPINQLKEKDKDKSEDMKTIHDMFATMMTKLQKLDTIEININDLKHSLEYAQAEIADLRKENEEIKSKHDMAMKKINSLERDNATIQSMRNKIIDL